MHIVCDPYKPQRQEKQKSSLLLYGGVDPIQVSAGEGLTRNRKGLFELLSPSMTLTSPPLYPESSQSREEKIRTSATTREHFSVSRES